MHIGLSICLIAIGAILKYAITESISGIDIQVVGVILMAVGILGLAISLLLFALDRDPGGGSGKNAGGGRSGGGYNDPTRRL